MKEKKCLSRWREKRNGTGVATSVRFASATAATLFGSHLFIHHFPLSLSIRFSYFYYWRKKITRLLFIRRPSPPTQHASDTETLPPPMLLLLLFIPVALLLSYILHLRFRTDLLALSDIFAFAFRRSREPKRPAHSARLLLSNRKRESTLILKVKLEK